MSRDRGGQPSVLQELFLVACSAVLSMVVLNFGLKRLDPNRQTNKAAIERKKELAERLGRPKLDTNVYEDVIAADVANPDHIDVTFNSIGGLQDTKRSLYELVILPLVRPELFARGKLLQPAKGVLLYGPPGTGKTLLAKALAKESGACFINVRSSTLQSKWFGDAQKLVSAVFTLAWKLQPSIIFIDEIDSFLGTRKSSEHEATSSMKTEFMTLWDGFNTDDNARVMVLGATNRPWDVDEAILRRLPRAFEIGLPNREQRAQVLAVTLKGENLEDGFSAPKEDAPLWKIAGETEGFSGSDLRDLCKQAAYGPVRDFLENERKQAETGRIGMEQMKIRPRPITYKDFKDVLLTAPPSAEAASLYQQTDFRRRTQRDARASERAGAVDMQQILAQLMEAMQSNNQGDSESLD
jgi:ATPase family AAA domain-containing protein 1|uniref:AAA+ ATPase domain-containing protein n=2 Tax=Ostreococcus mediterraneus TaxID=1486918 RepID=A0A6U0DMZ0_9CHLO|mmetsp:Transcript_1008/g.3713  ORF Transcript_1008/g.3713 Transcript_1008/m.3713 type:complete len:411 (-) Transcript_1008:46-1278(-)|eukprot:CAMPEP_0174581026 /NCGR_PEP_ID=MMETSP0929-20130131/3017_1 /TAXON_ID=548131 ORGANISM="Ostreococcus mediterraneus, Strain clade-D-RCC2572" /NCGR_SAMPLE_ID=MMETSP0929 /ASSEMBLY_ACC=CAM_ASM_000573 /LENGTH=410 /DNA_ID=CAMNT_0015762557 /DNA_START=67 /DNA_END=1299 /DNA_ORIENTATION=-